VSVREPAVLARQARAHADEGRLDEALALCQRALRRDPLNSELHVLAASIHQERGNLDQALAACRSAVYLAPESPMARLLLEAAEARRESAP
jgi:chemotaxis protein methyltransferase CheR